MHSAKILLPYLPKNCSLCAIASLRRPITNPSPQLSCVDCILTRCQPVSITQVRQYQRPPQRTGLFTKFIENIKEGIQRDKQLQENLKKFQKETKKIEESDVLQGAKSKLSVFGQIKEKASPYAAKVQESIQEASKATSDTVGKLYKEASESDVVKKGQEVTDELGKSAKEAASKISEQTEQIEKTETFKQASKAFTAVKTDLFDDLAKESRPYQRPDTLKRRTDPNQPQKQERVIEANEEATGVVMHKDSKWQQQWKEFRDNNPVVTGIFSLKTKYDESDNVVIRATRLVTDKLSDVFSDVFSQSEMAQTIAEITKIDPNFNKDLFLKECEFEIIPTVLEAFLRGDMDVLRDWCHDGAFNILSTQIKHNASLGLKVDSKVLDIREVELALAKVMEQGPVLILTFQAQQTMVVTDSRGKIVEGGIDNIENINYVWALCRDQNIFDHKAAWRLLEFAIQQATPYL